jgi:hypothetical protein
LRRSSARSVAESGSYGDADRDADKGGGAEKLEGMRDRAKDAIAKGRDVLGRPHVSLHDCELIASQPSHEILAAQQAGQALGEFTNQIVASCVPQRVVDVLEAVEVKIVECYPPAVSPRLHQGTLQATDEERAIGKSRQRIVESQMVGLRFTDL